AAALLLFDLLLAFSVSLPFVLLLPLLALAIKVDSRGPVFLVQRRIGENGAEFNLLKLRTMSADAEASGAQFASQRDPRVTRIGRVIRATRLDEFPKLLKIVRGEISFNGPRPTRRELERNVTVKNPTFKYRHYVQSVYT